MEFGGKSILIVDDDEGVRASLVEIVKKVGFKVLEAGDGNSAKALYTLNKPDVVLSDIRMPPPNGIEILHFIKKNGPVPFILMSGFSDITETREAFSLGADNFLSKPFNHLELLEALRSVLKISPPAPSPTTNPDARFCRIPVNDFTAGTKLKVDIYVKLSESKYICVAKESFELSVDRLDYYRSRGLHYFYIRREEFAKYVGLNIKISRVVNSNQRLSGQQKFQILKHAAEMLLQDGYINGFNKEKFAEAKDMVGLTLDIMGSDPDLMNLLEALNANGDFLYAHGLGVSLYSSLIANELGWTSPATKLKVSMGALLHDIGKKELDPFILEKARKDLNRHEIQLYETHPVRGRDILEQIQSIPPEVALIAAQHHENCLERGYPARLARDKIYPLAKLVSVANRFCELALKGPHWEPLSPVMAIDKILAYNANEYEPLFLSALMRLFDHPQAGTFGRKVNARSA